MTAIGEAAGRQRHAFTDRPDLGVACETGVYCLCSGQATICKCRKGVGVWLCRRCRAPLLCVDEGGLVVNPP